MLTADPETLIVVSDTSKEFALRRRLRPNRGIVCIRRGAGIQFQVSDVKPPPTTAMFFRGCHAPPNVVPSDSTQKPPVSNGIGFCVPEFHGLGPK